MLGIYTDLMRWCVSVFFRMGLYCGKTHRIDRFLSYWLYLVLCSLMVAKDCMFY